MRTNSVKFNILAKQKKKTMGELIIIFIFLVMMVFTKSLFFINEDVHKTIKHYIDIILGRKNKVVFIMYWICVAALATAIYNIIFN